MNSAPRKEDPRLLIAVAAAIVGLALWHLASGVHVHPRAVLDDLRSLIPIALGAVAIATAPATHRIRQARRTLASRRALAIVPADGFEPPPETVGAFASSLAAGSRRTWAWADRPASAVRVRLTNTADGRMAYLVEVPDRDLSRLRSALRAYRGIEVRDASDILPDAGRSEEDTHGVVRAEMVLARPAFEPLARPPLDPDPLAPFAAALAGVRRDGGEEAEVCVDLLPAPGLRAARLRRRMRRMARRARLDRESSFADVFGGDGVGRTDPLELYDRRASARASRRSYARARPSSGSRSFSGSPPPTATAPRR